LLFKSQHHLRQVIGVLSPAMAENSNSGSNNKIIGTIKYGVERHLIDFTGNSKLSYLLDQARERWPDLVPEKTIIKFLTPDRNAHLIVLKTDKDVRNMYDMHQIFGRSFAELEVEVTSEPVEHPRSAALDVETPSPAVMSEAGRYH
jgi:hypothetical protein